MGFGDFNSGVTVGAVVAGAVIFLVGAIVLSVRKGQRVLREHLATHRELSDEEFVRLTGLPPEQGPIALRIREAIATAMGWVPPGTVHPSDTLQYICQFLTDMDGHELASYIESELKTKIPHKLRWNRKECASLTVVDIITKVINDCGGLSALNSGLRLAAQSDVANSRQPR